MSFTNSQSSSPNLRSTPSSSASRSSPSSTPGTENAAISHVISNLLMNNPSTSGMSTPANRLSSALVPYDINATPSTSRASFGPIGSYQSKARTDDLSQLGSAMSLAVKCRQCNQRPSTLRCFGCGESYCYLCHQNVTSKCRLEEHIFENLLTPIGGRANTLFSENIKTCDFHKFPVDFYCKLCIMYLCSECVLRHRDHQYFSLQDENVFDYCTNEMKSSLCGLNDGIRAIKAAIDRDVFLIRAYEKEINETSVKIKRTLRAFIHTIEEREKYLLNKVENLRTAKLNELTDNMNSLRGILAALTPIKEKLTYNLSSNSIDKLAVADKIRHEIDIYYTVFKNLQAVEENLQFIPPDQNIMNLFRNLEIRSKAQKVLPLGNQRGNQLTIMREWSFRSRIPHGFGKAILGHHDVLCLKPARCLKPGVPVVSFGVEGQEEGQVSRPWGICVTKIGHIIVADRRNNRIQVFNSRGEFLYKFGEKGIHDGQFDLPAGITTDVGGRIIVVDKDNHRVQVFTVLGAFLFKFGGFGEECGQFQYPWDVAVNTLGYMVVSDTRNHRIQLFTSTGHYITHFKFTSNGRMLRGVPIPRGVCFTKCGQIIVADFENSRLIKVESTLTNIIMETGSEGSDIGELNRPSGIITDDFGNIIVADSKNHRVVLYTSDLNIIGAIPLTVPGLDDNDRPCGVAITPDGNLVVMFETLPDSTRDTGFNKFKEYIKIF